MIEKNQAQKVDKRLEDIEVNERQFASQIQMILAQQNKLIHNYYELDSKFRDVIHENKFLRNEFADLKKRFDLANIGSDSSLVSTKKFSFNSTTDLP